MQEEKCCVVSCDTPIDENFWNNQYKSGQIGWDIGGISPALKEYFDALTSKNIQILIPGCGNAHEASYLLDNGFTNITLIDIAPLLVDQLKQKFENIAQIKILQGDFFELDEKFDLIVEQTFFCALPPFMRQHYVFKMHQLLKEKGKLVGLLFDREFTDGPPFGGNQQEYTTLFRGAFEFLKFQKNHNSIPQRANSELFVELEKKQHIVALYELNGITCNGCSKTITDKISNLENVLNCNISSNFKEMLLVSSKPIALEQLRDALSYDEKYHIEPFAI